MTGKSGEKIKARFGQLFCGRSGGAAGVEVVEVEHGVEDEKIAAHCFAAPHRIVGEKNDVAFAVGTSTTAGFSAISLPPVIMPLRSKSFSAAQAQNHTGCWSFRRNRKTGKVGQVFGTKSSCSCGVRFTGFSGGS